MENQNQELSFSRFFEIYKRKIIPQVQKMEPCRIELLKKHNIKNFTFATFIIVGIILFLSSFFTTNLPGMFIGLALIIIPYTLYICIKNYNKEYKNLLKQRVMCYVLQTFDDIKWIKHDKNQVWNEYYKEDLSNLSEEELLLKLEEMDKPGWSIDKFNRSGLFLSYDGKYLDDEFNCIYKETPFNIYEIMLGYKPAKTEKQKRPTVIFNGVVSI